MGPLKKLLYLNWVPATAGLARTIAAGRVKTFRISMDLANWTEYEGVLRREGIETWGGGIDPSTDEYCFVVHSDDYAEACSIFERRGML